VILEKVLIDSFWIMFCAVLVFIMQIGFLCLEAGLTRLKNSINVAVKNLSDLFISFIIFWLIGFGLIFGISNNGLFGSSEFLFEISKKDLWTNSFFLFQAMFCGTAITIISGAVAERMKFKHFLLIALVTSALVYPLFAHWAWNGMEFGIPNGILGKLGFIDFAGATVVHSLGGWVALALLIIIGPRIGRFNKKNEIREIPPSNLVIAMLGSLLLSVGFIGFNAGSVLHMNAKVIEVILNTLLSGGGGLLTIILLTLFTRKLFDVRLMINGLLSGFVAITSCAHIVDQTESIFIGAIGAVAMLLLEKLLIHHRIDDAVGAVPVHLGAGIWGTLAVVILADYQQINSGFDFWSQIKVQFIGIASCGIWAFGLTYLIFKITDNFFTIRVCPEDEHIGLNVSEHNAISDLTDMLNSMEEQSRKGDLSLRLKVEPFTIIGQIASMYNRVIDKLEKTRTLSETIFSNTSEGITVTNSKAEILLVNDAFTTITGYRAEEVIGKNPSILKSGNQNVVFYQEIWDSLEKHNTWKGCFINKHKDGSYYSKESIISVIRDSNNEIINYIDIFSDVTEEKMSEQKMIDHQKELEEKVERRTSKLRIAKKKLREEISQHTEINKKLNKDKDYLNKIIDTIPNSIIVTSNDLTINHWNKKAETITGLNNKDVIGRQISEFYPNLKIKAKQRSKKTDTSLEIIPFSDGDEQVILIRGD
jgi:ammonium transporter, Amt family